MSITSIKIPTWFWVVSILALLWNLLGVASYFWNVTMTEEGLSEFSEAEQALYSNTPTWVTAAFAIGVFGGTLGCILLLLRKHLANIVLIISLGAVLVMNFYWFVLKNSLAITGIGNLVMQSLVIGIGIFLVWFSRSATAKGWLR